MGHDTGERRPRSQPLELAEVFAFVDEHRDDALARLFAYLRQPSVSAEGWGIAETAGHIAAELRRIGFEAEIIPTAGSPVVLATHHHSTDGPTVLLYGHYDVQPPDPLDAWESPPFEPTIRNGRLYARGVGDNKGQHFAWVLALEALLSCRGELPGNITFLLDGEEEIGSPSLGSFVERHRDRLRADLVVISDGPVDESGRSRIEFGVRGIVSFRLHARGANRDLHSGNWGGVVPNPLWTLVHLLAGMKNERGEVTINGFYENVLPLSPLEREALAALPTDVDAVLRDLELATLDAPVERGYHERLTAWPTFTINGLHGGYAGPGTKTVLPHEASVTCDMRLVTAQRTDEVFAKVEAHVGRFAPSVELERLGAMEPARTPIDSPYTVPIVRGMVAAQGEEPLLVPAMGGSLPTYVFTTTLQLPVFCVPYANADEANHAPNENLEVERFFSGIKTGAAILMALADQRRTVLERE